jgi:hypothetical protein
LLSDESEDAGGFVQEEESWRTPSYSTIMEHHQARGLLRVVLRGHIDPVIGTVPEDLARPRMLNELALRHSGLPLGVRPERVFIGDAQHSRKKEKNRKFAHVDAS